ncbi:MAG TPA: sugar ABC transporter permease [Sphaerochaeta sp.]|jgi:oligogalacturonide transport system permease protein|uniref:carbohydrate ABC transporter permease n=1 Tax=Sphaerochaeta sp. UBA5849 TaxID=1947475 RepID=UPI000E9527C1|nr:sugar ABC transporter permease [Sphaerochaeta sp.]HBO35258.1 sugar ABC transporter permease [Sphaerochaeta sp.]
MKQKIAKQLSHRNRKKGIDMGRGFLYLLPWLIGFAVFKLYPILATAAYSFTNYNLFNATYSFIGLKNYESIFTSSRYMNSFAVTFKYAFLTVPLKLAFALFIAHILNSKLKGIKFFRTAYYIPSILGGSVAIAVLWQFVWQNDGLVNQVLGFFGAQKVNWLGDPSYTLYVVSLLRVWQFGSAMVMFLAALKNVPKDLYEAAMIDGASKVRTFFSITIPLISPIIFYNIVTQLVQTFQEFNGPYIITQGGPMGSTTLITLLIYQNAFKTYNMGMASALAWLLFMIVAVLSVIAFTSQKYWVYYNED